MTPMGERTVSLQLYTLPGELPEGPPVCCWPALSPEGYFEMQSAFIFAVAALFKA